MQYLGAAILIFYIYKHIWLKDYICLFTVLLDKLDFFFMCGSLLTLPSLIRGNNLIPAWFSSLTLNIFLGLFQHQFSNALTPTWCPSIQINSDSRNPGLTSVPLAALTADTSCNGVPRLPALLSDMATNLGSHNPTVSSIIK